MHEDSGLRERSKARRRDAIIRAGLKLFAERGYNATTIADIAAEADVAPRTVTMYFPSKQDIALARFAAMVDSLTGTLCGRAPGESVTEVVGRWIRTDGQCADRDLKELQQRMFAANPELNALRNTLMAEPIAKGAELIASDTGAPPGDPGPRIAAVTAGAVVLQLSEIPPGPQKDEAIAAAMRFLDAGIATLGPRSAAINSRLRGPRVTRRETRVADPIQVRLCLPPAAEPHGSPGGGGVPPGLPGFA